MVTYIKWPFQERDRCEGRGRALASLVAPGAVEPYLLRYVCWCLSTVTYAADKP